MRRAVCRRLGVSQVQRRVHQQQTNANFRIGFNNLFPKTFSLRTLVTPTFRAQQGVSDRDAALRQLSAVAILDTLKNEIVFAP